MPKLRHIAIAAEDPFATAEFYKQAFDFTEVGRIEPAGEGKSYGVFLSDGTLNMAVLQLRLGPGTGPRLPRHPPFRRAGRRRRRHRRQARKARRQVLRAAAGRSQGLLRDQVPRPRQGDVRHHRSPMARQRAAEGVSAAGLRHVLSANPYSILTPAFSTTARHFSMSSFRTWRNARACRRPASRPSL